MTAITKQQRRRFFESLPFVSYVAERSRCAGVRWSRVPLKAVWHPRTHVRQPVSMLDPYRCKQPAHWSFRALKRSGSASGVYCMAHLVTQLVYDPAEEKRIDRYWARFTEEVEHAQAPTGDTVH